MSPERGFLPRRLLVALDASSPSLAALEAAMLWAKRFQAEVIGLFVREADWERVAAHPAARLVDATTGAPRPGGAAAMSEAVADLARRARRRLEGLAESAQVRASFRETQGLPRREVPAQAATCDIVFVGRTGWGHGARGTLGSTARALLVAERTSVLLLRAGQVPERPVALVLAVGGEVERPLAAALALSREDGGRLTVHLLSRGGEGRAALEQRVHDVCEAQGVTASVRTLEASGAAALARALHALPCQTLVLPDDLFRDGTERARVLAEVEVPVLLVR